MPLIDQIQALVDNVAAITEDAAQEQLTLINTFLTSEENAVIRVYVADTPGMGHQSNTVMIMYRLIQLGFNHNFEVVYGEGADNSTANKLMQLIPGYIPNAEGTPVDVELNADPQVMASIIPLTYFTANPGKYTVQNFGITGGFDSNRTNLANPPSTEQKYGLNVNFLLKLQPYQWNQQNAIQRLTIGTTAVLDTVAALGGSTYSKKRGYYIAPPPPPPEDAFTGTNATKYAPYQTIVNAVTSTENPVNLLPVYGISGTEPSGITEASRNILSQNVLFDMITAVRYAQRFGTGSLKRGAIIVNIANIPDAAYDDLNRLLSGADPKLSNLNTLVNALPAVQGDLATNTVEIIDYANPALADKIAILKTTEGANKVLVVKMGGIPVSAFNYMYSLSKLPCVLEGKASANMVLNMGVPYLNILKDSKIVYPTLPLAAADCQKAKDCNTVSDSFKTTTETMNTRLGENPFSLDLPSDGFKTTPTYIIGDFTINTYNSEGVDTFNAYFSNLQAFFQSQQQDKLYLGLLYFINYKATLPN